MKESSLRTQTAKGLYWKFAEQFSTYGIQFIIGIVLARLLSPSDFGITALPAVFMAIAGEFVEAGFAAALIRKPTVSEQDLSTAFIYGMVVGGICYLILFACSPWIADFYNVPVLKPLMRVTALSFIISPIGVPQNVILKRELNFKTPAKISVFVRILSGVVGITMAYAGYGVWALVISSLFSTSIGTLLTVIAVRWFPKCGWSKASFSYLWNFGNKMLVSGLLDNIYRNITPIIVGKFYSTSDLGLYNRAQSYAQLPSSQLHRVVMDVSFPVLSKIQNDDEKMIDTYRKMINTSSFVIFPLMILLAALARPLVITMITAKWEGCIILLQLLCFSMMWYPVHGINLNIIMVKGRSDLFLKLEVYKKVLGIIVLCTSLPFGLVAFCAAQIVSSIIALYINTWYTGKFYNFGFLKQMKDLAPIIILGMLMFIMVLLITHLMDNMYLQVMIGGLCGLLFFIGSAYVCRFKEIDYIKMIIK